MNTQSCVLATVVAAVALLVSATVPAASADKRSAFLDQEVVPLAQATKDAQPGVGGRYGYARVDGLLSIIDTTNLAVIARLPFESEPLAIVGNAAGTAVFIANETNILVIDPRSRTLIATVPIGGADQLLLSSDGTRLYAGGRLTQAPAGAQSFLAFIDTRPGLNRLISIATLPAPTIYGMDLTPDDSRIYVANHDSEGTVTVYDTRLQSYIAQIPAAARGPLAVDPSGRWVYVPSASGVSVIEVATDTVIASIPVAALHPFLTVSTTVVAFDPQARFAYIAANTLHAGFGSTNAWLLVVDLQTHRSVATIELPQVATALVVDPSGSRIYAAGQMLEVSARPNLRPAGVSVIDAATRTVIANLPPVSTEPYSVGRNSLVMNAVAGVVYATDSTSTYSIDMTDFHSRGTIPAAAALAFLPDPPPIPGAPLHFVLSSATGVGFAQAWGAFGDLAVAADYDGDGRADFAVLRPREGNEQALWYVNRSSDGGGVRQQWGSVTLGDLPVPADYDGDGRTDFAVWRPAVGEWFILGSANGAATSSRFGTRTDLPVPADYDGDHRADLATYHAGTWLIFGSAVGNTTRQLGTALDVPIPGDYDGDGRTDAAVFEPATGRFVILETSTSTVRNDVRWGGIGDLPVPADYDGDGKTDIAIWRPSTGGWWILRSLGGVQNVIWGAAGDRPEPKDFDGDLRADFGVHRP